MKRLNHYTTGGAVICDAAAAAVRTNRAGAAVGLPVQSAVCTGDPFASQGSTLERRIRKKKSEVISTLCLSRRKIRKVCRGIMLVRINDPQTEPKMIRGHDSEVSNDASACVGEDLLL